MYNVNDFKALIRELTSLIEEFNGLEGRKLKAVQQNLVTFVEEAMKEEQACIMRMRGLDRKRESIQKDLGWEGLTFQQILSQVSAVEEGELRPLFEQLGHKVRQFDDTRESAQKALEINLHHINKMLARKAASEEGAYTSDGNPRKPDRPVRHIRNTKA